MGKKQRYGSVLLLRAAEIQPNPQQPRRNFDGTELSRLAESIKENGILQPLTVRKIEQGYELVAGERRLRASQIAGLERVPCILTEVSERQSGILALVENLQREDLAFFEEAEAIQRLIETYDLSQEEMGKILSRAPSTLSNKLRLLKIAPELRERITRYGLTERHARALLRLEHTEERSEALEAIIKKGMNVQETDRYVSKKLSREQEKLQKKSCKTVRVVRDVKIFMNTVQHAVETMRKAGIPATSEKTEEQDCLIYTVTIPK